MSEKPYPFVEDNIPDIAFDLIAADKVMTCKDIGLRAYAIAGGLDPAKDFRELDLSGWELAGQDLRGFNFSGCDLRGTGIEYAQIDATTQLNGVSLDDGVKPGSDQAAYQLRKEDLARVRSLLSYKNSPTIPDSIVSPKLPLSGRIISRILDTVEVNQTIETITKNQDRTQDQVLELSRAVLRLTKDLEEKESRLEAIKNKIKDKITTGPPGHITPEVLQEILLEILQAM